MHALWNVAEINLFCNFFYRTKKIKQAVDFFPRLVLLDSKLSALVCELGKVDQLKMMVAQP